MSQSPIYGAIKRSNTVRVIGSAVVLVIVIAFLVLSSLPYFSAKAADPILLSQNDVLNMGRDIEPMYNVTIFGEEMYDSGWEEYTTKNGVRTTTDAYYGLMLLRNDEFDAENGRLLLVKTPNRVNGTIKNYTGKLIGMPTDEWQQVVGGLELEAPELEGFFLPVMLDTVDDSSGWIGGLVVLVIAGLGSAFLLVTGLMRMASPERHPIMKALSRYGDAKDVAKEIKDDMMFGEQQVEKIRFTNNWFIFADGGNFEATRIEDMLWIYKHVTQHRTNGIKTGKTIVMKIHDRFGREITVSGKENQIDAMLQAVFSKAPWVLAGYDEKIAQAMKKEPQSVIQAVQQRKAQIAAQQ